MPDQDATCETCRFWRRVRESALIGDCRGERSGRSYSRSMDLCAQWAGRPGVLIPAKTAPPALV